ncbi:MAG: lysophospholipid acyltransferase family protein [Cyanobacteria bacterium P01_A01_bin.17]
MRPNRSDASKPGWTLDLRNPKTIQAQFPIWEWFYRHYFRVQTSGWQHVPRQGPTLVVGSHNGGMAAPDLHMFLYSWFQRFGTERLAYGLLHPFMWKGFAALNPEMNQLFARMGAVVAHPRMAIAALRAEASVLVFPGGAQDVFRPHCDRNKIHFAGRTGFIKLALREQVPIVPVISHGAHDTLFVLTDIYDQVRQLHDWGMPWFLGIDPTVFPIYLGLPWGVGLGPLMNIPLPAQIHIRVCPPIYFDRYGPEAARDRTYVAACYQTVHNKMQQALDALAIECES